MNMLTPSYILQYIHDAIDRQRVSIALSRAAAARVLNSVNLRHPPSWEFSGFSQNGEDGILSVLRQQLASRNRYFVEIGIGDGLQNNCAWLAIAENHSGLMVDGNSKLVARARRNVGSWGVGVRCEELFVTRETAPKVVKLLADTAPDVFSLDIDGNDFYIAQEFLRLGVRPKVWVVEYNSTFGDVRAVTIPYRDDFEFRAAHPSAIYFGVSIAAWKKLFADHGYRFVTVEQNGVNAFFVDPHFIGAEFLEAVRPLEFAENRHQWARFRLPWTEQLRIIDGLPLVEI